MRFISANSAGSARGPWLDTPSYRQFRNTPSRVRVELYAHNK